MAATLRVEGAPALLAALKKAQRNWPDAFAAALYRLGVSIASEALPRTPVEFGLLRASHYVSPPRNAKEPSVEVGFGTRYAIVQHEATGFRHPRGGQAKFLRAAVDAVTPSALRYMADDVVRLAASGRGFGVEPSGMPTRPRYGPSHPGMTQKGRARAKRARAALRRRTGR